ncbi:8578_t:CDS:2 [Entrophospora sp. SA101]|nr:8578_t:CDS:2 [Entrophospora sp. SA101]
MLLAYFTSNSNLIPNFVINPPPDFDANLIIDAQGHTSLHWAAAMANIDMVNLLIKAGADAESSNIVGETALMRSVMFPYNYQNRSFKNIIQLLARSIGSVDSRDQTVFHHIAVFANSSKIQEEPAKYYLEILISQLTQLPDEKYRKSILNRQNVDGDTAINILAKAKNKQLVELIYRAGGDLHIFTTVTANNKVYTATPTVDSFVPIGKQILEDLRSPYVGELERNASKITREKSAYKKTDESYKRKNRKA